MGGTSQDVKRLKKKVGFSPSWRVLPYISIALVEGGDYAILNYTQKCFTFAFVPPFLCPAQDITLDSETGWTKDFLNKYIYLHL